MSRVSAGPECIPVKGLIRGLVQQILKPSPKPFSAALEFATKFTHEAYPEGIPGKTKGQYGNTYTTFREALAWAGATDVPGRTDLEVQELPPVVSPEETAALKEILGEAAAVGDPVALPDGALGDLSIFDDVPALTDDATVSSSSKLIQYAIHTLLPEYSARKARKPSIKCYVHEGQLYVIVLTESGIPAKGGRVNLNFTIDPFRTYQKAPSDVVLQTGSGKAAHAKLTDPDDPDHKWWAQFILHKPGRKLRFFGSKEIAKGEWADVPAATRYLVMTASDPWLRQVSLEEFRRLPNVDG